MSEIESITGPEGELRGIDRYAGRHTGMSREVPDILGLFWHLSFSHSSLEGLFMVRWIQRAIDDRKGNKSCNGVF
jgi:hypothetical protein